MAVAYLEELLSSNEYEKVLQLAEHMLGLPIDSAEELAQINHAICQARLALGEPLGAVPAGQMAAKLARDGQLFDLLGEVLLGLGQAHLAVRQYELALAVLFEYFEYQHRYGAAYRLQGNVWLEIGRANLRQGDAKQADWAFRRGLEAARTAADEGLAHRCRQGALEAGLQMGSLEHLPWLIAESGRYVRLHPADVESRVVYWRDKARYAQAKGRHERAVDLALRALDEGRGRLELQFGCHMVLCRSAAALGHHKDALGFALAARMAAIDCRRFELEFEAAEVMFELIRSHGTGLLQELDAEYLSHGLDLTRYVSESALKRHC